MPMLGLGVWQMAAGRETEQAVEWALEAGYRHIDTATMYRNERSVGAALARSDIPREEVFVTTKWLPTMRSARVELARSLDRLGLEHVDLYLIHWPAPAQDRYVDTWRAFERIHSEGRARTIGVSNFRVEDLERLEAETETRPTVNQIELHPWLQQSELRGWHRGHDVATEAWSPLGQGGELLEDGTIGTIAERHGKTPAQAVLRWHIQLGNIVFPKSVTADRIRENFALFDFELADDEMEAIGALDRGRRLGPDPARVS